MPHAKNRALREILRSYTQLVCGRSAAFTRRVTLLIADYGRRLHRDPEGFGRATTWGSYPEGAEELRGAAQKRLGGGGKREQVY